MPGRKLIHNDQLASPVWRYDDQQVMVLARVPGEYRVQDAPQL